VQSKTTDRFLRSLRPKGPGWARFLCSFLLFMGLFALVLAGLDWFTTEWFKALLPGSHERLGLAWILVPAGVAGLGMSVYLEWQLDRGIRQAAGRAAAGDQIGAVRQLNEVTGHGLAHSAAAVRSYLNERDHTSLPRELPEDVRLLADMGEQLRAVERLREAAGLGLEDAMQRVEGYLAGQAKLTPPGSGSDSEAP